MAEVFEVEDPRSGEHVALKRLVERGQDLRRFNREYEVMNSLNHPNIVRVYQYGLVEGCPYLTMELVHGTPVQAYARASGRPGDPARTEEMIRVLHDVAGALDHIHRRGLIHRDLKSANVLVLPGGTVKLIDFGAARFVRTPEQLTREGEFLGTFAYAAPEQIVGRPLDHRADLYSLGVLGYRMFTGRRPFEGDDIHALARAHLSEAPPAPRSLVPALPEALDALLLAMLAKPPDARPQRGAEIAAALEAIAGRSLRRPAPLEIRAVEDRLIGRAEPLAALREAIADPAPGELLVVAGERGSGGAALVDVLASERSARHLQCTLTPGGSSAPLVALLGRMAEELESDDTGSLSEASVPGTWHEATEQGRADLGELSARVLAQAALRDPLPLVVTIRGLEHAGPSVLDLLRHLRAAIRGYGLPVLFVGVFEESDDRTLDAMAEALGEARVQRLRPLAVREVALLVGALLGRRALPIALARQIHEVTGGHPTYVDAVVRRLLERGLLRDVVDGRIEAVHLEPDDLPLPQEARECLLRLLAGVPLHQRRLLEALAVLGGSAPLGAVARAVERCEPELADGVRALGLRGWLDVEPGRLTFRPALGRAVVLEHLGACRRDVLRRRCAEMLHQVPPGPARMRLLLESGRLPEALEGGIAWAGALLRAQKPVSALEVLEPLLGSLHEALPSERARLYALQADAILLARPSDKEAARALLRARAVADADDAALQGRLALGRARLQRVVGHYPKYRKYLGQAWRWLQSEPRMGAQVATLIGLASSQGGAAAEAAAWHERARRLAAQTHDPQPIALADAGRASLALGLGALGEAEALASGALRVLRAAEDLRGVSLALPVWATALREQGRFSEALDVLYADLSGLREAEAPTFYVRTLLAAAWCEVGLARLGRAQELVDELDATVRKGEHLHLRLEAGLLRGRILLESGEHAAARDVLAGVTQRALEPGLVVMAEHARGLLGEALHRCGEVDAARAAFDAASLGLGAAGDVPVLAEVCCARARVLVDVDPEVLFAPIAGWLAEEPARVARLERFFARSRHAEAAGLDPVPHMLCAEEAVDEIALLLNDTDRAALRVHPWSREIRLGHAAELSASRAG